MYIIANRFQAHLVEALVCKTYHNLTVLAELLASKDDMHRKMQIIKFVIQDC